MPEMLTELKRRFGLSEEPSITQLSQKFIEAHPEIGITTENLLRFSNVVEENGLYGTHNPYWHRQFIIFGISVIMAAKESGLIPTPSDVEEFTIDLAGWIKKEIKKSQGAMQNIIFPPGSKRAIADCLEFEYYLIP